MSLYQKSVLNKYLKLQNAEAIAKAYKKFTKNFLDPKRQERIRGLKEEQYQGEFLDDLFVQVFGYSKPPSSNPNLIPEYKNVQNSKKADGAIMKNGEALAVIELKSMKTKDLGLIEEQAFGYKNNQPGCKYVITSNFEKIRFYINNTIDPEEFDLFTLSEERFALLYLCIASENLLENLPLKVKEASLAEEENITKKFYADYSQFKRELFRDLVKKNIRNDVFRNVLAAEETEKADKNIKMNLFKKSQKLIDRFLFVFFAEDRGLLPPNSTEKILADWNKLKDLDAPVPLYNRFKLYFHLLFEGRGGTNDKAEIYAYNGGLFKPDAILDSLLIDDELLYKHTRTLAHYDFDSQVDVNILGHIFENSLNEIESINAEIEGGEFDKQKSKRKKDGVFYTPKYITKYIVDNTVGKLCDEKKVELGIVDVDFTKDYRVKNIRKIELQFEQDGLIQTKIVKSNLSAEGDKALEKTQKYREFLLELKICDPACGSGAFLNQALDFLISEHKVVDEMVAGIKSASIEISDIENTILEKNIYGVDLNEESVEIAKLSLWLRTAQKGRKLNSLNNNIKCGNSLIESKAVAGDKAFKWEDEFPEVFKKGGFDVVIGNPPYVGEKGHSKVFSDLKLIPKWAEYYRRRSNLYYFFIKLGVEIMKEKGRQALIIPREFINADWANKVRFEILNNSMLTSIVDFNDLRVFEDAGTTSLILFQSKMVMKKEYTFDFISLRNSDEIMNELFDNSHIKEYSSTSLDNSGLKPWSFYQDDFDAFASDTNLSLYFNISQGVVTGADRVTKKHFVNKLISTNYLGRGIFILSEGLDIRKISGSFQLLINDNWVSLTETEKQFIKPFIKTENLLKWYVGESSYYIINTSSSDLHGAIKDYLIQFSGVLLNRSTTIPEDKVITLDQFDGYSLQDIKDKYSSAGAVQKIMRRKQWWMPLYERADVPFEAPKIIVNTKNMDKFTYSDGPHYSSGGGAGGQNYIYLKSEFVENIETSSNIADFTIVTNAILNSKLIQKYIEDGQYNQLSTSKIGELPFVEWGKLVNSKYYSEILERVKCLTSNCKSIDIIKETFCSFIKSKLSISVDINSLLNTEELATIFSKYKVNLSISEEAEWAIYFNEQKQKVLEFVIITNKLEKEIDQMVYELYGLSEEEIKIVEGS